MRHAVFNELLATHRDRVYSRALYSLRDARDAEDVTQEAFLRLWRQGGEVPADRVGPWLAHVTRNLCIDQGRRRAAARRHLGVADPDALDSLPDHAAGAEEPLRHLDLDDRQRQLLEALQTLTAETRDVMLMHYYEGRKLADIAASLGKSLSAVKVQVHRARHALRLVLEDAETTARRKGLA
ncbi:MAG: RNA polymerase sigma factor [bacterium]|nr:RNA polymerase sigma factor [bacterium]